MLSKKRFVIAADVALLLARKEAKIFDAALVAPTLLRSQALSHLYSAVRKGDLGWKEAEKQMDYLRKLQIRFLGDRVMQQRAWDIASKLDLSETYLAEYIAVTQLQADALVTLNPSLLSAARHFVSVAAIDRSDRRRELIKGGGGYCKRWYSCSEARPSSGKDVSTRTILQFGSRILV